MSRPEKKETKTNLNHVSSAEAITPMSQLNADPEGIVTIPHNASFSSVEIELLASEKTSQRINRVSRSQSLSRTLIRSFRRKKKPAQSNESTEGSNHISNSNDSRITSANETSGVSTAAEDATPRNGEDQSKISRILRMGSINRFKLRRNKSTSSLNDCSNVRRSTSLVNFFKRERKDKANVTADLETTVTQCEDQIGSRKSRLRDSMRRFRSNKSSSTSTEEEEGTVASTSEKSRWRPRRSMSMFGSSFNLRKIFHNETVTEEVNDESINQEPRLGSMKRSEGSRQRLSQLTSTPAEIGSPPEGCNDSGKTRRNSFGEKLKAGRNLFKRDSFILKKSSKSANPEVDPAEDCQSVTDIIYVDNENKQGHDEPQLMSTDHKLDEGQGAPEDNISPESTELQTQQQSSVINQLESKDPQEKPLEETNQTKDAKTITQEANGTDYNRLSHYREFCIDCGYTWRDWILQSCLLALIRPVFDVGFLFLFLLCLISCGLSTT